MAVIPEERFINFFAERRHPTRDPGTGPGWLATVADEQRFLTEVLDHRTALLIVSNRPYIEFRRGPFAGYQRRVMAQLERHFALERSVGPFRIYRRRGRRPRPAPNSSSAPPPVRAPNVSFSVGGGGGTVCKTIDQRGVMRPLDGDDDMVSVCLFLLSDDAGWMTGQILAVDGGQIMRT